jgi:hypothetical protein
VGDFWHDTRQKVVAHQRRRVQTWFSKHPLTFAATLGIKGLTWDIPAWGARTLTGKARKIRKADGETVTVIERVDSDGSISETRIKHTEISNGQAAAALSAGKKTRSRPSRVRTTPISPEERLSIVKSGKQLLTRTPLGKEFVMLAGELNSFTPVRGLEALTTSEMTRQLSRGTARISMGVEAFSDIVAHSGISRRITSRLHGIAAAVDTAAKHSIQCHKLVESLYNGQIAQDASGTVSVASVPVRPGTGDEAAGIWPHSNRIANFLGGFEPETNKEATQIYGHMRILQAGFALVSDVTADLPTRLQTHGVDHRVTRLIGAFGGEILDIAMAWRETAREMGQLYQGQLDHEASEISTIRTAPMRTK